MEAGLFSDLIHEVQLMPLDSSTHEDWVKVALADFDEFLIDHAACERKAAALAMSMVVKFSDRPALIEPMICLAREELAHFHEVYCIIAKRGLKLGSDFPDPYLKALLAHVRHGRDEHFLDRLLIGAIVEARGCERFALVAKHHPEAELREFYEKLARVEAGHYMIFVRVARQYFAEDTIRERLSFWREVESKALANLALRPAVH